ncbi:fimbrial protein [Klebsiella sp. I138]|uniref:fimbrial protein n=1 Tax=Klebsiella sp. I138 TaxID=2755385 RepID=UPI003DA9781D
MKKTLIALVMAGFASQAMAAGTGTIEFKGLLTANTCNATVNDAAGTATVTLPTLSKSLLPTSAATAGDTAFTIELKDCTGTLTTASAYFEAGTGVNTDGRLINTGDAANVDVQLLDGTNANAVIKAGSTEQIANTKYVTLASEAGTTVLPYTARYYATGSTGAGAGTVTSSVTYSIQYK